MRLLYDSVLIREVRSKGQVIVPDKAQMRPEIGEVIGVGPGDGYGYAVPKFPMTVKAGDKVWFIRDRAQKIELAKGIFYVIRERDVLGILEEGEMK